MNELLKLLVVDDEPLARRRILSFDLEGNGFKVVGEAENGQDAFDLIMSLKPDIVVTDIIMPVMDGLELMEKIQTLPDAPKVVLLTCYDDFSKVQAALRLGAQDYLVKALLKEDDFIKVICKVSKAILKEKLSRRKLIRNTLTDLMLAESQSSSDEYIRQLYELGFTIKYFRLALIDMDPSYLGFTEMYEKTIEQWAGKIRCILLKIISGRWFAILYTSEPLFLKQFNEEAASFCTNFIDQIKCKHIILGRESSDLYMLHNVYTTILSASQKLFYAAKEELIIDSGHSKEIYKNIPGQRFQEIIDRLRESIVNNNGAGAAECIMSWLGLVISEYHPSPAEVKIMASLLSTCIPDNLTHAAADGTAYSLQQWMKENIEAADHIDDIANVLSIFCESLTANLKNSDALIRSEIGKALEYIHRFYSEDVSLERVAEHVGLSPSWFGKLFRVETQQNFSEYLTSYRMTIAEKLLVQSNMLVNEVADQVGIHDPHYFTRIFTKFTGLSPKDYRKCKK